MRRHFTTSIMAMSRVIRQSNTSELYCKIAIIHKHRLTIVSTFYPVHCIRTQRLPCLALPSGLTHSFALVMTLCENPENMGGCDEDFEIVGNPLDATESASESPISENGDEDLGEDFPYVFQMDLFV